MTDEMMEALWQLVLRELGGSKRAAANDNEEMDENQVASTPGVLL